MKDFLSHEIRLELELRHDKEHDRCVCDRIKAILLADKGWEYKDIAEALRISPNSVVRFIKEYLAKSKLKPENGGSSPKLNEHQALQMKQHLSHITYTKVEDICAYVKNTYGISYTVPGMTHWLHHNGFSYKKPAATPAKADPTKQEAFIQAYEELKRTTPEDEPVLFDDGVHPTMATKVSYGWIPTGARKPIATTASRTRMNLLGSLNLENMALHVTEHQTLNHESMVEHLEHIRKAYPKAPKIHLIVDRGPYNISQNTKEYAIKLGIVLHYLPPYSPNLNPIERCWKIMNEQVRNNRFFESAQEFRRDIRYFFDVTWPKIAWTMRDRVNDNFQRLQIPSSA